ncbi:F-box/WD repeat-containing protein 1A-like [Sycon ciliatum]|uniref:F-box/WD repeat-containing protein 1A-like n=1 Tax=Sycon ciliatum TaxID=27933 RepID=UPI0020A9461B
MASATIDHSLDEEVGSYWKKDLDLDESKPQKKAKMLERMSSTRPWLRRRISRKASQSSMHSPDADAISQTGSTHSHWPEDMDQAYCESEEAEEGDEGAARPWIYGEKEYSVHSLSCSTRTFGDSSEMAEIEGFFDRSEQCVKADAADGDVPSVHTETSSADFLEQRQGQLPQKQQQQQPLQQQQQQKQQLQSQESLLQHQPHAPLAHSPSAISRSSAGSGKSQCSRDSWYHAQGSTGSLPLALASDGRKFAHVPKAGPLPCRCPSCCTCCSSSSSGGSLQTLSSGNSCTADRAMVHTFPRLRSRKTCPLRSSLEFTAKRSHPGSLTCIVAEKDASGDQQKVGHREAVRLHSAPGSIFAVTKSRSPSMHSATGSLGYCASAKQQQQSALVAAVHHPSLGSQMQMLGGRNADDFGSVQTLCQEKALVEEEECGDQTCATATPAASAGAASAFWTDGRIYKARVQTMLDWFDEFSDQQRNLFLERLLGSACGVSQMHYLSTALEPVLHESCPHNCQDLLSWLPMTISWHILSFLDPVSLCRASQVSTAWYELASEPVLWRRLSKVSQWRPSELESQRLVNMYTCPDSGFIDWKHVFSEMYRLRRNWLQGRFTVRTFAGHTSGISCVQFDDTRIVSGSSDRTIKVWDIRTNTPWCALTLVGHSATVRCLHLRGNQLVSGSADCTIKVWDLSMDASGCWSSAACRVTMIGHLHTVRCLKVDDTKVVSGSYDMSLKVWDLKSGQCLNTLHGHAGAVICLQYDEERIVSGAADNTIKVWRLHDGECLMTLVGHQDAVTCLQFDSEKIISGSVDCAIKFWSIETGQCIQTLDWIRSEGHRGVVRDLQADSWKIVSAADDKTLKVWSIGKGQRLLTLHCHTDGVTCLQFNDRRIVSGSYDKTVKLYDFSAC